MGLLEKNQVIIEDLEQKLREKESECSTVVIQHESEFKTKLEYLESENRVLKELQDAKMTSEKDRKNFHKTLRNLLLEEIERIEKEQTDKENNLATWREHFTIEMQQERDELAKRLHDAETARHELEEELQSQQAATEQNEAALNSRIEHLTRTKESLEQKIEEKKNREQNLIDYDVQIKALEESISNNEIVIGDSEPAILTLSGEDGDGDSISIIFGMRV